MEDLITAIECGLEGSSNYGRLFVEGDGFTFHPDPNDSLELVPTRPEAYSDWHYQVELAVFDRIASLMDSIRVDSLAVIERDDGTPETRLKEAYIFTLYPGGPPTSYRGVATFYLLLEAGTWKMSRWADERKPDSPSWGSYKGALRQ